MIVFELMHMEREIMDNNVNVGIWYCVEGI